jgi:streptogramin lyase
VSFRIQKLWAFVAQEPGGDEGIIAERNGDVWLPFVAADERRIESLRARAMSVPIPPGTTVRLVRFDARTEIEFLRGPQ